MGPAPRGHPTDLSSSTIGVMSFTKLHESSRGMLVQISALTGRRQPQSGDRGIHVDGSPEDMDIDSPSDDDDPIFDIEGRIGDAAAAAGLKPDPARPGSKEAAPARRLLHRCSHAPDSCSPRSP